MGNNNSKQKYLTNCGDVNQIILNYLFKMYHYDNFKQTIEAIENIKIHEKIEYNLYDETIHERFIYTPKYNINKLIYVYFNCNIKEQDKHAIYVN